MLSIIMRKRNTRTTTKPLSTQVDIGFSKIILCLTFWALGLLVSAQTGIVRGRVSTVTTNKPIEFATVGIDGTTIGTQTDDKGEYEIKNLTPGLYNIKISSLGYTAKTIYEIEVTNAKPAIVMVELESSEQKLNEVVVKANSFQRKEESPVSVRSIGVNEIQRYPGGNRDISNILQSLPGVGLGTSFRNDLIIRGGSTAENKFYCDDIEIPNINHFVTQGGSGGPRGILNVDFIREVNFYTSAFPANRGNTLSSAMDIRLRDGRDDRWGGTATLGITESALSAEGPLNKKKTATLLLSARTSYFDWFFKLIDIPIKPTFTDFQLKAKWKISPKDELIVLGLVAIDNFTLNLAVKPTEQNRYTLRAFPFQKQYSNTEGLKYTHFFDKSSLQIVASTSQLINVIDKYQDNNAVNETPTNHTFKYRSTESETKLRAEWTKRTNGWKINIGGNYEWAYYYNSSDFTGPYTRILYQTTLNIHKYGASAQVSKSLAQEKLTLSLGLRLDGNSYNASMANPLNQLSPRLSLSYAITDRIRWNFNTGYYHQTPTYLVLGYRDSTGGLVNQPRTSYMRNLHLVTGFELTTKVNSRISIEGFYKQYFNVPFLLDDSIALANKGSDFGFVGNNPATSTSKGRAYGVEFLYEQKLYKGWFGIVAYTLFWSQFENRAGGYSPSSWDTRHIISLTAGKKFKHNWELGGRFRMQGGQPYTPFNQAYSSQVQVYDANPQGVKDYSQLNAATLPWFHQLDMRVSKKWYLKKWSIELYLDVQNLYFHKQEQPSLLTLDLDAAGNKQYESSNPNQYKTKLLKNESGVLQPSLGLILTY
jgi:CarboxypepD_reg-like domain/TonB-dependent Receptor Plug Domain